MRTRGRLLSSLLFVLVAGCNIDAEGTFDINTLNGSLGGASGEGGFSGSVPVGGSGGSGTGNNGGTSGSGGAKSCKFPGECNDNNPCTKDACVQGICTYMALPGANCGDQNKCNGEDTCDATGQCQKGQLPVIDDGNACTADICDPATGTINHKGQPDCTCATNDDCNDNNLCTIDECKEDVITKKKTCSYTNKNAGTPCDDNNKCTEGDTCDTGGKCQGSLILVDDGNPCTTDTCDPATGQPVYKGNVGQPCSDNNACTIDDTCDAKGKCEGFPLDPDDNNPCTFDFCDPITGNFSHKGLPNCKSCKGNDNDCDDGNPCTIDTCKADICDYQDVPPEDPCDDGNACTLGDKCNLSGKCVGDLKNVDDGNPCTTDSCDPATGNAVYTPAPGHSCSDGNACTLGDLCDEQGQCIGVNKSVDDGNACTNDACDPVTGNVSHTQVSGCKPCSVPADCNDNNPCTNDACQAGKCGYTNASAGTSCSDNNPCTEGDKCNASGQCIGTPKNVDDGNPCTADSCNPVNGSIVNTPSSGASCNDGNACTLGDQCDIGVCKGIPKNVNDGNECTIDSCDQATGNPVHTPVPNCKPCSNAADCNDNNPCTNDACQAGKCSYTNAPVGTNCNDSNPCTDDDKCTATGQCAGTPKVCNTPPNACHQSTGVCNQATGTCSYAFLSNGTTCSDNNPCTLNDTCQNGNCTSGTQKACTTPPDNQCYNSPGTCNAANGECSYSPKTGSSCDDGDACTNNDQCNASGKCEGTTVVGCKKCNNDTDCNDNNICTNDTCDSNKKCVNTSVANGTSCSDNNGCTLNDTCQNGTCTGSTSKTCGPVCNGHKLTTGQTCQAPSGDCAGGTTADCPGNHSCENATQCWSSCSQSNTDDRCAPGFFCLESSGHCVAKRTQNEKCTANIQCLSGTCTNEKKCQ